jgi:hypothetical protein
MHKILSARGLSLGTDLHPRIGVRVDHAATAQPLHLPSVESILTNHINNAVEILKQYAYETGMRPFFWNQISVIFERSGLMDDITCWELNELLTRALNAGAGDEKTHRRRDL